VSWGDFLASIVDVNPLGEMRIHGTVSWSDFSYIKQVPMLEQGYDTQAGTRPEPKPLEHGAGGNP